MAYIGKNGVLELRRTYPEPVVIPPSAFNTSTNSFNVEYDDWYISEQVYLIHDTGYLTGYIHRTDSGRVRLHGTTAGAAADRNSTVLSLNAISINRPAILSSAINTAQINTLTAFQSTLTTLQYERSLRKWPETLALFNSQKSDSPWMIQGQLRSWQLNISAPEVDTGALSDKYGSAIKTVITGSGTLDFVVDLYSRPNYNDIDPVLRLVQLTNKGGRAGAKFHLKSRTPSATRTDGEITTTYTSSLYFFDTTLLITEAVINMSAEDLVYGSANFVTTGPIRLLSD